MSCERESVTVTDGGGLIVDCSVHGEIGTVPGGRGGTIDRVRPGEMEDVERLFVEHVATTGGWIDDPGYTYGPGRLPLRGGGYTGTITDAGREAIAAGGAR